MKKTLPLFGFVLICIYRLHAQTEPNAGSWKTWFIASGKEFRLPPSPQQNRKRFNHCKTNSAYLVIDSVVI